MARGSRPGATPAPARVRAGPAQRRETAAGGGGKVYAPRMGARLYPVAALDVSDRRNVYYWTARTIALFGHRFLVRPHIEMDDEVVALKRRGGAVFLYCGLHKSLWETSGVLPPLYLSGLPVPYVGMGDNLVKGRAVSST